jgi:hypothetical protein
MPPSEGPTRRKAWLLTAPAACSSLSQQAVGATKNAPATVLSHLRGISRRTGCRRCQAGSDASAAELGRHIGVGGSDGSRSPLTPPRPVRSPACKRGFSFGRFCCYRLILDYQVPVGIGRDATELKRLKRRYSKRTGETLPNPHIPRPGLGSAASPPLCGAFLLPQRPPLTQRRPLVRFPAGR